MIKTIFTDATCPTPGGAQMSGIAGSSSDYPGLPDAPEATEQGEIGRPMQTYTIEGEAPGKQVDAGAIANTGKNRTLGKT